MKTAVLVMEIGGLMFRDNISVFVGLIFTLPPVQICCMLWQEGTPASHSEEMEFQPLKLESALAVWEC